MTYRPTGYSVSIVLEGMYVLFVAIGADSGRNGSAFVVVLLILLGFYLYIEAVRWRLVDVCLVKPEWLWLWLGGARATSGGTR